MPLLLSVPCLPFSLQRTFEERRGVFMRDLLLLETLSHADGKETLWWPTAPRQELFINLSS